VYLCCATSLPLLIAAAEQTCLRHCYACRDHLLPSDFLLFFDGDTDTANEAFAYFDRNGDGSISCSELQESAAEMLCERKNIAASIKVRGLCAGQVHYGTQCALQCRQVCLCQ
jgi:hypothetical protein